MQGIIGLLIKCVAMFVIWIAAFALSETGNFDLFESFALFALTFLLLGELDRIADRGGRSNEK